MQVGIIYPVMELGGDASALAPFGCAAEELGFDHIGLYDHVLGAVHEGRDRPLQNMASERDAFHDPFVAFAYLAGMTRRISFVTSVLVLPQRPTVLVAKQAADLSLLSGGRLRLGVGVGWNHVEYEALGQSFETRGQRMSEQVRLLRRLWSEPVIEHAGKFDRIDRGGILPLPNRQIPIYCGGFSDPAYRRAAELADGFIFSGPIANCLAALARVRELLAHYGRSEDSFGTHYVAPGGPASDLEAGQMLEDMKRWRDAGGTCVTLSSMRRGLSSVDQHIDFLSKITPPI